MNNKLITLLIYGYPFSELLNGFVFRYKPHKLITNSYIVILIWLILLNSILHKEKKNTEKNVINFAFFISIVFFISTVGGFLNGYNIKYDIAVYIRSILFGFSLYIYIQSISGKTKLIFIKRFIIIWWFMTTFFILISYYFDIGLYTYERFYSGRKFYFPSNNELTIFYSSLSIILVLNHDSIWKYAVIATSVIVFLIIGVKSFIISYFLIVFFQILFFSYRVVGIYGILLYLSLTLSLILLVQKNIDFIINIIIKFYTQYSLGGEKIIHKLSYLSQSSVLVGERNIIIRLAIESIKSFDIYNIFFGYSYSAYGIKFGKYAGETFKFAENDILDIAFSYGLFGLTVFIILFFNVIKRIWHNINNKNNVSYNYSLGALNVLVLGAVTGHGLLFSLPILVFVIMYAAGNSKTLSYEKC